MFSSHEKPTIVFDIDGLANFPHIQSEVLNPLRDTNKFTLGFWSLTGNSFSDTRLNQFGITTFDFSLGGDIISSIEFDAQNDHYSSEYYERYVRALGVKRISRSVKEKLHERIQKWRTLFKSRQLVGQRVDILKYPPFLSDKPTILIESDCSIISPSSSSPVIRQDAADNLCKDFAKEGNFSLILTPEYYSFGKGHAWIPEGPVSEQAFLTFLREQLLNWSGEQVIRDLGEEMGIYPFFRRDT